MPEEATDWIAISVDWPQWRFMAGMTYRDRNYRLVADSQNLKPAAWGLVRNLADNPVRKYYYWKLQLWPPRVEHFSEFDYDLGSCLQCFRVGFKS
jgi:hypothetical protein